MNSSLFSEMALRHPDVVRLKVLRHKLATSTTPADQLRRKIEDLEQKIVLGFAAALDQAVSPESRSTSRKAK